MMKILAWILLAAVITAVVYLTWNFLVLIRAERAAEWGAEKFVDAKKRFDESRDAASEAHVPD